MMSVVKINKIHVHDAEHTFNKKQHGWHLLMQRLRGKKTTWKKELTSCKDPWNLRTQFFSCLHEELEGASSLSFAYLQQALGYFHVVCWILYPEAAE